MSLENELAQFQAELKAEEQNLAKFEAMEIVEDENNPFSIEERIEARERGIRSTKESIEEIKEIIEEIKEEMSG